jgi:DNA-binding GntR family transcriptional regulator
MDDSAAVAPFEAQRTTIAAQVFDHLLDRIVRVDLPPGSKISEAEVAKALGVSRQPVREAFFRLQQAGLVVIRPQRATTVAPISERAVFEAQFIRVAIETATMRRAVRLLTDADVAALGAILERQKAAIDADDRAAFHALDDAFHRDLGERAGAGFAWGLIREQKLQMDRVRYLSLGFNGRAAWAEHGVILAALAARDADAAVAALTDHLSRIGADIRRIRAEHGALFSEERGELL